MPLEIIHSDFNGKMAVPSLGGSYYYFSLIDDYTRFSWIYFLKRKSDVTVAIMNFIMLIENQTLFKCKRFHCDQGGEYINNELKAFFVQKGILYEMSPAYCHEYNGVAERFN